MKLKKELEKVEKEIEVKQEILNKRYYRMAENYQSFFNGGLSKNEMKILDNENQSLNRWIQDLKTTMEILEIKKFYLEVELETKQETEVK